MTHCRKTKINSTVKHQINPFDKRYQYSNALINTHITKWKNSEMRVSQETVLEESEPENQPPSCSSLHSPPNTSCDPFHNPLTPAFPSGRVLF